MSSSRLRSTDYHIIIFYSEEDEAYVADIPDFKMCSAFGATPEEALAGALALRPWLEPRFQQAIYAPDAAMANAAGFLRYGLRQWA